MPETIFITGGSGYLGVSVAKSLLAKDPSCQIILSDLVKHPRLNSLDPRVFFVHADLSDPATCEQMITSEIDTIYHFASLVSGGAEKDFLAGFQANIQLTINLLEACRKRQHCPRFVFTSSIATFGGNRLPSTIDDWTHQHPQNSYGVAKVIGEQLLNDYSRKGYVDGRGVRLAAIVVRDEPNSAASGYASSIIREPLAGRDYICPVAEQTRIPILSTKRAVEILIALGELPAGSLGDYRTLNSPSLSPSAFELAQAAQQSGSDKIGKIKFKPDEHISDIVSSWPVIMKYDRAYELGLYADESVNTIVQDYLQEIEVLA